MGPTSHQVSFVVAGGEPRNKPVAGPVPDVDEETVSSDTGPMTDAGVKSNAETSNTGTNSPYSAVDSTYV
jgi:hypothetical protein